MIGLCRETIARRSGAGGEMRLVVYPGAHHAFNAAGLREGPQMFLGRRLEYNDQAERAAREETFLTLRQAFGR